MTIITNVNQARPGGIRSRRLPCTCLKCVVGVELVAVVLCCVVWQRTGDLSAFSGWFQRVTWRRRGRKVREKREERKKK